MDRPFEKKIACFWISHHYLATGVLSSSTLFFGEDGSCDGRAVTDIGVPFSGVLCTSQVLATSEDLIVLMQSGLSDNVAQPDSRG